jgi:hypothetical protein
MGILSKQVSEVLNKYSRPADAAKAVYKICRDYARDVGMKPDIEVQIRNPEQNVRHGYGKCWAVSFEAGPYEWAVEASMNGGKVYAEPHYSFDLQFYGRA